VDQSTEKAGQKYRHHKGANHGQKNGGDKKNHQKEHRFVQGAALHRGHPLSACAAVMRRRVSIVAMPNRLTLGHGYPYVLETITIDRSNKMEEWK
jgi:hypothetical protein